MKQELRIIGGKYRGKKIAFPDMQDLRPTPNRVRETLFNWLMQDIREAQCLDAFSGSGALGFEALSRGAASVTCIEQSPLAFKALKTNAQHFNAPQLHILQTDAHEFLKKTTHAFDIIFLDPPFASELLESCLKLIAEKMVLKKEGLVYLESAAPLDLDPLVWEPLRSKKAGMVYYGLFRKI